MSDGTAAGPTLGEIYWDTWGEGVRKIPYSDLADEYREHTERAAAAAGAAAIARLNQPAELAAAMAETRKVRDVACKLLGLFGDADSRRMRHADVTMATLDRYAAEAGIRA